MRGRLLRSIRTLLVLLSLHEFPFEHGHRRPDPVPGNVAYLGDWNAQFLGNADMHKVAVEVFRNGRYPLFPIGPFPVVYTALVGDGVRGS